MRMAVVAPFLALAFWSVSNTAIAQQPFPFAIGGSYALVDQHGRTRTQSDPDGRAQLVFFGYVNCPDICTAAFPLMADLTRALEAIDRTVTPVMITVAPDVDRVDTMGAPLAKWHPEFVGLTGSKQALQQAYDAFSVEITPLFQDPEHGWIYSHGSFIHLLDANGDVLSLLPPVLSVDQALEILRKYVPPDA